MRPLARLLCVLATFVACAGWPAQAALPLAVQHLAERSDDDPRGALEAMLTHAAQAERRGDAEARFWWLVTASRVQVRLERETEARALAATAAAVLSLRPGAAEADHLWLQLASLEALGATSDPAPLVAQAAALRQRAGSAGDARLSCEAQGLELWLLIQQRSDDEAWLAAEALERCARNLGSAGQQATAQLSFATLMRFRLSDGVVGANPQPHLEHARRALDGRSARFIRSLIEWEAGIALRHLKQHEAAVERLQRTRELSRELRDDAGVAVADIETAAALLELNRPAEALQRLQDVPRLLASQSEADLTFRMPRVLELRLLAMARLGRADVLAEVERAQAWVGRAAHAKPKLQRAMALALASQRHHAAAYEMLLAAGESERVQRTAARDSQMLRLQARYDTARREAENAELRLRSEASRLALAAEGERRRTLTIGVVALAALALLALTYAIRQLARRRRMADLALRDELTGVPNRRAIRAYAEEQLQQARRLKLPISLALIDLDHFKSVNDRYGHAVGDAVLRAFTVAAHGVLRGQDRLGRWGGEEWLLVMPGTAIDETSALFERLRRRFSTVPINGLPEGARCTFSMGVAELDGESREVETLVASADAALYAAKEQGRDRCERAPLPAPAAAAPTSASAQPEHAA